VVEPARILPSPNNIDQRLLRTHASITKQALPNELFASLSDCDRGEGKVKGQR
jgi:hypothetical protein